MIPSRIQRKRSKGWRMPENCIYVGRPTEWGNPFTIGQPFVRKKMQAGGGEISGCIQNAEEAVYFYRRFLSLELRIAAGIQLRGKNLACWCGLDQPCHADILLEIANLMTPSELKPIIEAWGGMESFAKLIHTKERTVKAWLYGERTMKPNVAMFIRSLTSPESGV